MPDKKIERFLKVIDCYDKNINQIIKFVDKHCKNCNTLGINRID